MAKTPIKTDALNPEDKPAAVVGQDEQVPEADDDVEPAAARSAETDDAQPAAARKPEPPEQETADDDPRTRAVKAYRAKRDREAAEAEAARKAQQAEPPSQDDPEDDPEPQDQNDTGEEDPEPTDQPKDEPKRAVEKVMLVVDGKLEEVSLAEAIKLAQIAKASDNRLEEAKRLLKEARGVRGDDPENQPEPTAKKPQTQPDQSKGRTDPEHQPAKGIDPDKLRQITERIQVGDADEGANAMAELVQEIVTTVVPKSGPADTDKQVKRVLAQQRHAEEFDAALEKFSKEYPDVVKDELLADAGKTVLRREIIKDLKALGIPDEDINSISGDDRLLTQAHRDLKVAGHAVRSYDALFDTAGKTLSERFNIKRASQPQTPTPKPVQPRTAADPDQIQARVDRKRAAPQQPRAVGVRQQVAAPPKPRTALDVVRAMRKGRGFSVTQ